MAVGLLCYRSTHFNAINELTEHKKYCGAYTNVQMFVCMYVWLFFFLLQNNPHLYTTMWRQCLSCLRCSMPVFFFVLFFACTPSLFFFGKQFFLLVMPTGYSCSFFLLTAYLPSCSTELCLRCIVHSIGLFSRHIALLSCHSYDYMSFL